MLGELDMNPDHLIHRFAYMKNDIPIAGCAHQAGTCRFGTDPATSVLDVNCKAHELDNLYVVDTSVFPSIGAVNPALTAMANSLRVGDHLLERLGGARGVAREKTVGRGARLGCEHADPATGQCPSGEQFEIAFGDQRVPSSSRSAEGCAVVLGDGGGRTSSTGTAPTRWHVGTAARCSFPWPNRLQDGATSSTDAATSFR